MHNYTMMCLKAWHPYSQDKGKKCKKNMVHCIFFFVSKILCVQDVQICKAALAELIKKHTDIVILWYLDEEKVSVGGKTQKNRTKHQNSLRKFSSPLWFFWVEVQNTKRQNMGQF